MAEDIRMRKYSSIRDACMNPNDLVELKEEIVQLKLKIGLLMSEITSLTLELHKERQEKRGLQAQLGLKQKEDEVLDKEKES